MEVSVLRHFKPILEHFDSKQYLYYVYYGGRGGGKTESIAQCLVMLACTRKIKILCIRETQSTLAESVKSVIESWIDKLELWSYFKIISSKIECTLTGSEFLFIGMRSSNAVNVKSIHGVDLTWIEEAEAFSKRSWDLLVPSVTRTPCPGIIISFNPYREDDIIYKSFIVNKVPPGTFIKKINYDENPYFKSTNLEQQRAYDEQVLTPSEYAHKWLGELRLESEYALFDEAALNNLRSPWRAGYVKTVIAADPATTNKDFSNEYGIIVMSMSDDGCAELREDLSSNMTPTDFAQTCIKAYHKYHADTIVVEVNNGGDFIKSAILSIDPCVSVTEVRASTDKVNRALPVANLAKLGKFRHGGADDTKLVRQMKLITQKGFLGEKGESPDRLDAYVWAAYELFGLKEKEQRDTLIDLKWFEPDADYASVIPIRVASLVVQDGAIYGVIYQYRRTLDLQEKKEVIESFVLPISSKYLNDSSLQSLDQVYMPDTEQNHGVAQLISQYHPVQQYEPLYKNNDDMVMSNLAKMRANQVMIGTLPSRSWQSTTGQLLKISLSQFRMETDNNDGLLKAFCALYT